MSVHKNRGFSLLELMVAILIISVLAAVSGPIYRSYVIKSKFAEVFKTVSRFKDDMAGAYLDFDSFPEQINEVPLATFTAISSPVLKLLYYDRSTNKQAGYMHFYTLDLGVDGFQAVGNDGSGGAKSRVTLAALVTATGELRFYCGQWDATIINVPLEYLPKTCQDTSISSLIT